LGYNEVTMEFARALKEKFDAGAREHSQPWDAEHIDARKEMQDELCDLWNYSDLLEDEDLKREVQGWCKYMWKRLFY